MVIMDDPSAQLELDLRAAISTALSSRQPVLHHLNADSSWLLQIPRPVTASKRSGRFYYNVLIDPWLSGPQSDVASWFSQQWHSTESEVGSIAALEELLRTSEILANGLRLGSGRKSTVEEIEENGQAQSFIDVVTISHEFTDHCHKDTLLEIDPEVPVIASPKAAALVRGWSHFRQVLDTPVFSEESVDWHETSVAPLPDWVGISRMTSKSDALYYHSALMIAFSAAATSGSATNGRTNGSADSAEAVIYTPHGIHWETLNAVPKARPPIQTLAFLHGLHDVSLDWGQQLNLGAHNGLKAQRILNSKYWIGTHDEVKTGSGFVGWFLRRKVISIGDALQKELDHERVIGHSPYVDEKEAAESRATLDSFEGTNWVEISNGESKILI